MSAYLSYLDGAAEQLRAQISALKADGRQDEADFARIELNIHEICRTVYLGLARMHEGDALQSAYLYKLAQLPVNWEKSLALAREHGDHEKIAIEKRKLAALHRIQSRYLELE